MKRTGNAGKVGAVLMAVAVLIATGSTVAWAAAGAAPGDESFLGAVEVQKPKTGCIADFDQLNAMNISILNHIEACEQAKSKTIDIDIIKVIDDKLISTHTDACAADADGYDTIYACKAMRNFAYITLFTDYKKKGECYKSVLKTVTLVSALRKEVCPKGGKRSDMKKAASTGDEAAGENEGAGEVPSESGSDPANLETSDIPGDDDGGGGAGTGVGAFSTADGCTLLPNAAATAGSALTLFLWLAPVALVRVRRRQS